LNGSLVLILLRFFLASSEADVVVSASFFPFSFLGLSNLERSTLSPAILGPDNF
jgi:hypothetical protein